MRMLPSQMLRVTSPAEDAVFNMLRRLDLGQGAVCLHSLNLPRHQYKRWAEADFIIVCEFGLLVLEVKGGRVSCKNGLWEFQNRYGEITKKSESPAIQAKTAFFALRDNYLQPRFSSALRNIPMGWAVVFTGIERLVSEGRSPLPDQPDDITAYRSECLGHNVFGAFIRQALQYWGQRTGRFGSLSPAVMNEIASYLRPNFEQVPPLANRLDEFGEDLAALTDEQYARLDDIQENDRIIVRGGAGTGKTFLAMACARYDFAQGREVLFTTRSRHLVEELKSASPPEGVDVLAFNDVERELESRGRPWTSLVIDEGQDLCQFDSADLLSRAVSGGLEGGRWRWFGDPNRQVSESHPVDEDVLSYFAQLATKCKLKQNVRNAPKIVEAISRYAGADVGLPPAIGQGSDVVFRDCGDPAGIIPGVVSVVRSWVAGQNGARRSDVAVLVPLEENIAATINALGGAGIRSERLVARPRGKVRDAVVVAQIEEFKGLERPLVCVAGLASTDASADAIKAMVYRSFSRANHTLALCCSSFESEGLAKVAVALSA